MIRRIGMQKSKLRGFSTSLLFFAASTGKYGTNPCEKSETVSRARLPDSQTAKPPNRNCENPARNTTIGAAEASIWWKSCTKYNNRWGRSVNLVEILQKVQQFWIWPAESPEILQKVQQCRFAPAELAARGILAREYRGLYLYR